MPSGHRAPSDPKVNQRVVASSQPRSMDLKKEIWLTKIGLDFLIFLKTKFPCFQCLTERDAQHNRIGSQH